MSYRTIRKAKPIEDLTGQRFSKLVVVKYFGRKKSGNQKKTMWLCKCDCGNEKIIAGSQLKNGSTTSCGCVHKEMVGKINRTHGLIKEGGRLYPLWKSIKYRCYAPTCKSYVNYGGRGIKMCDEWRDDFKSFHDWALANGYKEEKTPGGMNILTIDRIDVNGNYEPSNCRFITNDEQSKNKRNSIPVEERWKICPICGKQFEIRQRNGSKTCSYKCGAKLRGHSI